MDISNATEIVTNSRSIVDRNRCNGQLSTGPRSARGKAGARRNSLRHGLCANPAANVVEDARLCRRLHGELVKHLKPSNVMEDGLVDRIAVCLWRLQRCAKIDAAVGNLAASSVVPERAKIQEWIKRINGAWRVDVIGSTHPLRQQLQPRFSQSQPGQKQFRPVRLGLRALDGLREWEMMHSSAALVAMMLMIQDLVEQFRIVPGMFMPMAAEKLAWLLGVRASSYPLIDPSALLPGEITESCPILDLIAEARSIDPGDELPVTLRALVENRLMTLRQQRVACEYPQTAERGEEHRTAALLPEAGLLDRLIRCEAHAERSFYRALDALAKLRGVTVESLSAIVTGTTPQGAKVAVRGERTR
jgi:hypothetical protein